MSIRVAVDAMGGDHAPDVVVDGVLGALQRQLDIDIVLTGPLDSIQPVLNRRVNSSPPGLRLIDAPDVISMHDSPSAALKTKTRSSIHLGLGTCKDGGADAFVSAGNTGAVMAASLFILGRLEKVRRPSLIGYFPTLKGHCILIDSGANVDCKPEYLVQFAQMGSVYVERVMRKKNPDVALMNIGEEPGKGNEQAKATYDLLTKAPHINFVGNIEGRDIMGHAADVVVADGFIGNILLKFGESVATVLPTMIGAEMNRLEMSQSEQLTVSRALKGVRDRFDYQMYGGAPLLGVNGTVIVGHGSSNAQAIENMIVNAAEMVREDVAGSIVQALAD
jgi:phosphate acyltransferase